MSLIELAERVEKASGPDRELDGWIWAHLKAGEPYIIGNEPGRFPRQPIYGERADVMRNVGGMDGADYIGAPKFTASLDAAMMLVPEGASWQLGDGFSFAWAIVTLPNENPIIEPGEMTAKAATPALALVAAALRARAQQTGERQ